MISRIACNRRARAHTSRSRQDHAWLGPSRPRQEISLAWVSGASHPLPQLAFASRWSHRADRHPCSAHKATNRL